MMCINLLFLEQKNIVHDEPRGHSGLSLSSSVSSFIQNDLLTVIFSTFPSMWNCGDLELFVL